MNTKYLGAFALAVVGIAALVMLNMFNSGEFKVPAATPATTPAAPGASPPAPGAPAAPAPAPNAPAPFKGNGKVIKTASGLQYEDMTIGDGNSPKTNQHVLVDYLGTLENGTKFDASYDRGEPFEFQIGTGGVIAGWDEGVATMKVGGRRKLIIPAALGYGSADKGAIPPNSTLIFDVTLKGVSDTPQR